VAPRSSLRAKFRIDRDRVVAFGLRVLPVVDRFLMRFAVTAEHQIFPNDLFPWTAHLAANWSAIRDEAQVLLRDRMSVPSIREISADHEKIALDEKWRSFFFWGYGLRVAANCGRCPETARALEQIPGLLTALYSVMLAGAHVPRHTGATKAIVTAHMGLIVPARREHCRMRVGDAAVVWEEGRIVIFDDMYPHEVWNDTDEDRIILMLHVKRPLRFPGSVVRDLLFAVLRASPFVKDAVRNLERWEKSNTRAAGA
jgi:aspartyl/asparaginyl beta-hydroxylase (cupin superfamily)